jgi:hypothetical protein
MGSHPYSRQVDGSRLRDPFPVTCHSGEDDDALVLNAQGNPTTTAFETLIGPSSPDGARQFVGGRAITKTTAVTHTITYVGS